MTKPAPRRFSRRSITSQGFRLSDSEMAQKSWPSGAPTRAATASIAVTPGTTVSSRSRHARRAGLDRLADGRRHGEDAGIAARDHRDSRALRRLASAAAARDSSSRLSEAMRDWSGRELEPVEIGTVAEEVVGRGDGAAGLRRHLLGMPGPSPTTASLPLTAVPASRHQTMREIGRPSSGLVGKPHRRRVRPSCRARHRRRGRACRSPRARGGSSAGCGRPS